MTASKAEALKKSARLVNAHEYYRCNQAFLDFAELAGRNIAGSSSKQLRLRMFDAYARFLHHLHEFYVGVVADQLGRRPLRREMVGLLQKEVERIMKVRAERIRAGRAPSFENFLEYYEEPVPPAFAADLRDTRNRVAHADVQRAGASGAMTLPTFYHTYHRYVMLLYEEAEWLWKVDAERIDWGEIESFDLAVRQTRRETPTLARLIGAFRTWVFERKMRAAIRARR